jgi:hypothetical protein
VARFAFSRIVASFEHLSHFSRFQFLQIIVALYFIESTQNQTSLVCDTFKAAISNVLTYWNGM